MHEVAPGAEIAGYRIERIVGYGGMGRVYLATQLDLGRQVALKLIAPEYADDGRFRERFKQESRLAASIDHPNVIPVYEARDVDGFLFLSMRYVDGPDLRHLVKSEGPLEPGRGAGIVAQVASALDAAHQRGLVHRDVKPGNVLIADGEPEHAYLTDFGLVKSTEGGADLTASGQFVGTLDYTAPEQIQASRPDARTDVYALGGVLFYALTGRVPFERETDAARIYAHLNDPPPRPSDLIGDLPDGLDEVVERAMAKDPAERFPSAGDLGRATRAAAERRAPSQPEQSVATGEAAPTAGLVTARTPRSEPATALLRQRARRRPPWIPLAGVLAAAIAAVFVLVISSDNDEMSGEPVLTPDKHVHAGGPINSMDGFQGEVLLTLQEPGGEKLARLGDSGITPLPVPPAQEFAGVDVGPAQDAEPIAVFSRCKRQESGCDVYRYPIGNRDGVAVPGASSDGCEEVGPSVESGAIAYGVYVAGRTCAPGIYLKRDRTTAPERVYRRWNGGTELNRGLLTWIERTGRGKPTQIRILPTDAIGEEPMTFGAPSGHEFTYPIAIESGQLYFIDHQFGEGQTQRELFFIARADASKPQAAEIDRYGSGRAVAFTRKPKFAIGPGEDWIAFSGDTEDDPRSNLETITRDEDPSFTPGNMR